MKKSKSESASRMSKTIENNNEESDIPKDMRKKERVYYDRSKKPCNCISSKKKSIKLCSNLYEINMRYVPTQQSKPQRQYYYNPTIDFSQN
jgi:hypothetical protein